MDKKTVATNRKAFHNYNILETIEAGIALLGYEVKALRGALANISDGYIGFAKGEAFLENVHINPYEKISTHVLDFNPTRKRKLLLHKTEIGRLESKAREKGLTVVPLEIFFNEHGFAKVKLGLGKGKHASDKRETLRRRDMDRDMERELK